MTRRGRNGRGGRGGRSGSSRGGDGRGNQERDSSERAKRYNRREQRVDDAHDEDGSDDSKGDDRPRRRSKNDDGGAFYDDLPIDGELTDGLGESDEEQIEEEPQRLSPSDKKKRGKKARIGEDRKSMILIRLSGIGFTRGALRHVTICMQRCFQDAIPCVWRSCMRNTWLSFLARI